MNKLIKILLAAAFALPAFAQTATPSTTLCAAQTKTQTSVCLTSTTNVVNQTGVYVDQEYELVQISANTAVCTGPCNVPVSRNNRNAGSGPTPHANSAIAWLALTPTQAVVPGVNGFSLSTNVTGIGPCIRTNEIYLPAIFVNRGIKRDCNVGGTLASGQTGVWVDYAPQSGLDFPSPTPLVTLATNGALCVCSGQYEITKGGLLALTLAAPTSGVQDGTIIKVVNSTAYAHTITATSLFQTGGSGTPYTTATFAAHAGGFVVLQAIGGYWYVLESLNVTLS
jgi:hypothetical protein